MRAGRGAILLVMVTLTCMPGHAYVVDADWELHSKEGADPVVYTKRIEDQPIRAVKAITLMDVPMSTLLSVLCDAELVPSWVPVIKEVRLLQPPDPDGISFAYMLTNFPWPTRDRDIVVETMIAYDEISGAVMMQSSGVSGHVDHQDGVVRTETTFTRWKISPTHDGRLRVEIITHSDPEGRFPKWLFNAIVTRVPGLMFDKLQETVETQVAAGRPFDEKFVFGREVGMKDSAP